MLYVSGKVKAYAVKKLIFFSGKTVRFIFHKDRKHAMDQALASEKKNL
jgi:hypothetical protein